MSPLSALWHATVGKKIVMAVTGIVMVLFLISHVISNVLIFSNPGHLDSYGAWLRSLGPLLWIARAVLLACVILHGIAAWQLTQRAHAARPDGYDKYERQVTTYAGRTMRWGGVLLAVFIVFHILHFTTGTFHPDFHPGEVGRNVITGMAVTPVAIFYLVAMLALGAHLWHGTWSVFQTLGINHPAWNRSRKVIAIGLAVLIAGGFATIPLAALLGWLR
ncbi:MAG TPA: succinate dehydrogenase cytochrome b subunit [Gemmatimonadales bacterium]|jgi:succinate dehydrogenase / fumarate reductase cytochrome b subunit|nr:succinate dehydrogenase cytochrome b subunit [Gemmatimonadales bacterium]